MVFISYSNKDMDFASEVNHRLVECGITTWFDRQSLHTGEIGGKLAGAIRGCNSFLLLLSESSQKSRWVRKEIFAAHHDNKPISVLKLSDVNMDDDLRFYLGGIHLSSIDHFEDLIWELQQRERIFHIEVRSPERVFP